MATSQNPGGPDPQQSAKVTEQALKDLLKLNGDYNSQLKSNIRDLDQQIKAYGRIEAKLATLYRPVINTLATARASFLIVLKTALPNFLK